MYNGVINVYKEKGFTSFDVVAKLRGILHQKKIGHTGTLDPDAEGVLVVCLGSATKLCEILTDKDKSYEATLLLGKTSDTEDISGNILSECDVTASEEEIRKAVLSFVGEYEQTPPMYSAIKVNGKKLYELAREGKEIERTKRPVVIQRIDILSVDVPRVTFKVSCGKGTYIRSLCRDIGEKLGCGGLMEQLVRNSVDCKETGLSFVKEDALTLAKIEELVNSGMMEDKILPIDSMFPKLPRFKIQDRGEKKLANGNILKTRELCMLSQQPSDEKEVQSYEKNGTQCLVYDWNGVFTAIYRYDSRLNAWKAEKMFL
ncbi:MAG: tRNA pseudouridine(55) synthase TruB [Lachnospiraceae bacterium]|nr:tRNA pseudouridine(55) synthase TruB [Lachnospiraceae bacterium]